MRTARQGDRFTDIVIRTGFETGEFIAVSDFAVSMMIGKFLVSGWHGCVYRPRTHPWRHHHIQNNQVRRLFFDSIQCFLAV